MALNLAATKKLSTGHASRGYVRTRLNASIKYLQRGDLRSVYIRDPVVPSQQVMSSTPLVPLSGPVFRRVCGGF